MRLNGVEINDGAQSLLELVERHIPIRHGIAVAVNGDVIPRSEWAQCHLATSDVIEVVTAAAGG